MHVTKGKDTDKQKKSQKGKEKGQSTEDCNIRCTTVFSFPNTAWRLKYLFLYFNSF